MELAENHLPLDTGLFFKEIGDEFLINHGPPFMQPLARSEESNRVISQRMLPSQRLAKGSIERRQAARIQLITEKNVIAKACFLSFFLSTGATLTSNSLCEAFAAH